MILANSSSSYYFNLSAHDVGLLQRGDKAQREGFAGSWYFSVCKLQLENTVMQVSSKSKRANKRRHLGKDSKLGVYTDFKEAGLRGCNLLLPARHQGQHDISYYQANRTSVLAAWCIAQEDLGGEAPIQFINASQSAEVKVY